tara:strand:+ start:685 stop:1671 length:987 start_codon:yes stop_codon:yes gene_type:complete
MAYVSHGFSPKEWKVAIVSDATNAGATGIGSTMLQLDVDSVSMPSLNPNQVLDVRTGAGRTFKDEDFFQDNTLKVSEISLSGTMHLDSGHKLLLQNICNDVTTDIAVAHTFTPASQKYGSSVANAASSLTLVMQPSDVTNQQGMEFFGCVVTSFTLSADSTTEGGRYKFSVTLQTGKVPDLASTATPTITAYANTTDCFLSSASGIKVYATEAIMQSFAVTIENPAVFTGFESTGYQTINRGAEIAVTAETSVKYDGNTQGLINSFGTQTSHLAGNALTITNNNAYGVAMPNAVLTDVSLNEGDIMMLDVAMKAVDKGEDLITFDVSS